MKELLHARGGDGSFPDGEKCLSLLRNGADFLEGVFQTSKGRSVSSGRFLGVFKASFGRSSLSEICSSYGRSARDLLSRMMFAVKVINLCNVFRISSWRFYTYMCAHNHTRYYLTLIIVVIIGLSEKRYFFSRVFLRSFICVGNKEGQSVIHCPFCSTSFCHLSVSFIIPCSEQGADLRPHLNCMLYHARSSEENETSGSMVDVATHPIQVAIIFHQ